MVTVSEIASGVGESLRGILDDLTTEKPKSLRDVFLEGDRLRGLGVFLMISAALLLVIARS
jgi:hypothetical protein